MKTDKLYYSYPYLKTAEATVTSVSDNGFTLDRTIFYPECGGQRGDSGWFGKYRIVTTVEGEDDNPFHITDGPLPQVGEKENLSLDWDERYFSMIEHTAQHLLSSLLFSSLRIATLAVHHGREEITIETDDAFIGEDNLLSVEDKAMELVGENRRVWMDEMDREAAESLSLRRSIKVSSPTVRVVFIENQDKVACGGVHISSLGEIGEILYVGSDTIRGHIRTHWRVAKKAKQMRRENARILKEAQIMLSAESTSFISILKATLESNNQLRKEIRSLRKEAAEREFEEQRKEGKFVYSTSSPLDLLIDVATKNIGRPSFIIGEGNTFMFVGEKALFDTLKEKYKLQGGGREPLFRGKFSSNRDELLAGAESLFTTL